MNKDKDSKINYSEFVECSKQDPTVMDVRPVPIDPCNLTLFSHRHRHSHSTMALYSPAAPAALKISRCALQPLFIPI